MAVLSPVERSASEGDDALVRRAAAGEKAAFDPLIVDRFDRCYRLARSILANDADAADATQDAFVAAWRELPTLRDTMAFDGWLNRIVATRSLMCRRHRRRLREVPAEPTARDGDDPSDGRPAPLETESDLVVERDTIGRAFDRLSEAERSILVQHHVEDRAVTDIARALDVPLGTAKWRLYAARRKLERAIAAEGR
jgi:RNA polymerase sigma-70 factor, ECF subfamily